MQYQVVSHHETDGMAPGWYVAEFDEQASGRVVAGPFTDEWTAQVKRDLLTVSRQDHVENYVEELIGDGIGSRAQMLRVLKGSNLTESEIESVITQVRQALEFEASFEHRQATGAVDADMDGCAA